MALREVRWTDIEQLAALEAELFENDAWSQAIWWGELAGRPRRDYVVETDELGIAGYAGLDLGLDMADVMTVAVAPRAQRCGLGRALLAELVSRAREAGAGALLLEVRADNTAGRRLYERSGFQLIATRAGYYQPGSVDALVLRLLLAETAETAGTAPRSEVPA